MHITDYIKERRNLEEAKIEIIDFLKELKYLYISSNSSTEKYVNIDRIDYRFLNNEHFIIVSKGSPLYKELDDQSIISTNYSTEDKCISGQFTISDVTNNKTIQDKLIENSRYFMKLIKHGSKIFSISVFDVIIELSPIEFYSLNDNNEIDYSYKKKNNEQISPNTRYVLLQYEGKECVLNAFVDGDNYYALSLKDSNKIKHINEGLEVLIFDGKDEVFNTKIKLDENTDELFKILEDNNFNFFKKNQNLIKLTFKKGE